MKSPQIWPPMPTPFRDDGAVDFDAIAGLVDFYIGEGVAGLLVTGLSGEPLTMDDEERIEIVRRAAQAAAGRVPIAACVFRRKDENFPEAIRRLQALGVDCSVLLTGQLAQEAESDALLTARLQAIVDETDGDLGLYEAPRPYKRLLEDDALAFAGKSERFTFFKDTCCDIERLRRRIDILKGTRLLLLNAHVATFRQSMEAGANGFCGLMANVFPAELARAATAPDEVLSLLMTVGDTALEQSYPGSAKCLLAERRGVAIGSYARALSRMTVPQDCPGLFALADLLDRDKAEKAGRP